MENKGKVMKNSLIAAGLLATATTSFAADYTDGDTHKNDYKWMQGNIMYAVDELPGNSSHDYLELEFGGRSGILDYYGYVDVFDLTNSDSSDKAGSEKIFMKFAPRVSLDGLFETDLSVGPVQEVYLATLFNYGGGGATNCNDDLCIDAETVNNAFVGLGSDIMVPWLGKVGFNVYGLYDMNAKDWNGYQVSTNWFKPVYFFENGSFISYQGYIDYQFGANDDLKELNTTHGGAMFNGIYWHSDRFALGYGLKAYSDVYALKDGGWAGETTGFAHYFAATYKF